MTFADDPDTGGAAPVTATVELTRDEFVAIARMFGALNDYALRRLGVSRDSDSIYSTIAGDIINPYWENGVRSFGPSIDVTTVNNPL